MQGHTKESEIVRMCFVKLCEFITENQVMIKQAVDNNKLLKKLTGKETIYFFAIDTTKTNIYKIGRSNDIIQRLKNYNVGIIKCVDLKYLAVVKNNILIEQCVKLRLNKYRIFKNKEIYNVNPNMIKKVVRECFCENTSKKEKIKLYEELFSLLGLYGFIKNKEHFEPYIVIDK